MISPLTAGVTVVVALLIFGPKSLSLLARNRGLALSEFKNAMSGRTPDETPAPVQPQ
ncbi:MAG: twin-arginine translocase TatA/TatE family subunit [Candidatus Sericytochromatia bacterium]|nr:twin-arginine translocase TatA/TatE family subunit [Candidatus Sericytochromatia bacterium]